MPENFLFETAGLISTITFNRPERRNCMNRDVMLEFEQLILRVRDDRTTRVLIVTGIGAANGFAVGGGWALAAAFDFVIASEHAQFWVPEVELGVPFAGSPAEVMAKRLGPWLAKEAMIMCRHYSARELFDLGMLNKVVKQAELMPAAQEFAERLLKLPAK